MVNPAAPCPTHWSNKDINSPLMELSNNSRRVRYRGQAKDDLDAAAVRANVPIDPSSGLFYFEVTVVNKGREGHIAVGLSASNVSLNRLPGWEKGSYAYHADDGNSFCSSGTGTPYGPVYTTGDVVGVCLNFVDNTCFFTKNGTHLGIAFRDLSGSLYPSVGMRTPGEEIEVNFGHKPFEYDIQSFIQETKEQVLIAIHHVKLSPLGLGASGFVPISTALFNSKDGKDSAGGGGSGGVSASAGAGATSTGLAAAASLAAAALTRGKGSATAGSGSPLGAMDGAGSLSGGGGGSSVSSTVLNKLVLSYLVHHGYSESVALFARDTGETVAPDDVINVRKAIRDAVLAGDVDAAMRTSEEHFPALFVPCDDGRRNLLFKLKCQKFIELVRRCNSSSSGGGGGGGGGGALEELMVFGRDLQCECELEATITSDNRRHLEDAFSLLAYPDVASSPVAYLLHQRQREEVASTLNSAILAHQNVPERAPLETIAQSTQVALQELVAQGNGAATFVSLEDCFV